MRIKPGDRVLLKEVPGRWRIESISLPWVSLSGRDSFAQTLASLSPDGIVDFRRNELLPDTTDQETLPL